MPCAVAPFLKQFIDLRIVRELLDEDIHLQCLELRCPQESFRILRPIVVIQELLGQAIVAGTDFATIMDVELP